MEEADLHRGKQESSSVFRANCLWSASDVILGPGTEPVYPLFELIENNMIENPKPSPNSVTSFSPNSSPVRSGSKMQKR